MSLPVSVQYATSLLLNYLGSLGYHVSPYKAQLRSPSVMYLHIQLNLRSKSLTSDRVGALQSPCPQQTKFSLFWF